MKFALALWNGQDLILKERLFGLNRPEGHRRTSTAGRRDHGDTGRGCGANHQTGWTALVLRLIISQARPSEPSLGQEHSIDVSKQ
jgi:hypothetical protein